MPAEAFLIKPHKNGKLAVPISKKEAEQMVSDGSAFLKGHNVYETCDVKPRPKKEPEPEPDREQTYDTKVMTADKPRKRGRPRKDPEKQSDSD